MGLFLTKSSNIMYDKEVLGAWLSLVECCIGVAEVAGSNPVAPIN